MCAGATNKVSFARAHSLLNQYLPKLRETDVSLADEFTHIKEWAVKNRVNINLIN